MPKLSPTMETGVLSEWKVKVGDPVKEGDILAVVETDKSTMEMKSYDEGTVAQLVASPGDEVALGQLVLVLAGPGEDAKALAGKPTAEARAAAPKPKEESAPVELGEEQTRTPNAPEEGASADNGQERPAAGGRVRSSPLARKIAATAGVNLSQVAGSGPGGRVIRRDVETFLKERPARPAPTPPATAPVARPAAASRTSRRIPHSRMRKTIA